MQQKDGFWTGHSHCTQEPPAALDVCRGPSQAPEHPDFVLDIRVSPPFPEELLILNSCLVRDAIFFRYVASYTTPPPMMGQEILFSLLDHTQEKTKKQEGFLGRKFSVMREGRGDVKE